jgi:hypothetical protein
MGGYTQKRGQLFHVRKEIADEGENHRLYILSVVIDEAAWGISSGRQAFDCFVGFWFFAIDFTFKRQFQH